MASDFKRLKSLSERKVLRAFITVLWQLNNNLYRTIKINKTSDNINRYLSSLRSFASLNEILQNHEENILIFAVPGCGKTRHRRQDSFYLRRRKIASDLPVPRLADTELTVSAPIPF